MLNSYAQNILQQLHSTGINNKQCDTHSSHTSFLVYRGYMADYKSSSQEDVPQYGRDEAVKV